MICKGYLANDDGSVKAYVIEILDEGGEWLHEVVITPSDLASHQAFKRVLLAKEMFYSNTATQHSNMLRELFTQRPQKI